MNPLLGDLSLFRRQGEVAGESVKHFADKFLRRRRARREAERPHAFKVARRRQFAGAVNAQTARTARRARHLHEPLRVGTVRRSDHEKKFALRRRRRDRVLTIFGGVADVAFFRSLNLGKAGLQDADHFGGVADRERGLSRPCETGGVVGRDGAAVGFCFHEEDASGGRLSEGAGDFGVVAVSDEDDLAVAGDVAAHFAVDFLHERAGRVNVEETARARVIGDGARDAVRRGDDGTVGRRFAEFADEDGAFSGEVSDDPPVVDDFVSDIDGFAEAVEGVFHGVDGACDAGAESSWRGEEDGERRLVCLRCLRCFRHLLTLAQAHY